MEARVKDSDSEQAARQALAEAAAVGLAAKVEARDAAKAALAEAAAGLKAAAAGTKEALKAQEEGDEAYNQAAAKKSTLESALAGDFASLKETPSAKALKPSRSSAAISPS